MMAATARTTLNTEIRLRKDPPRAGAPMNGSA
jgi:hypothetical protein